jgi:hypothetical protein
MVITGRIISKKQNTPKPYVIPEPKILRVLAVWGLAFLIALTIEITFNILGVWTFFNPIHIPIHAGWWWATAFTICVFVLTPLKPIPRYLVFLFWVIFFEHAQEAFVRFWIYYPLFGVPFLMDTIIMVIFCSFTFIALDIAAKAKIVKKT